MLRLRRYRVFLFFAVFTVFAFYRFSGSSSWQQGPPPRDQVVVDKPKPPAKVEDLDGAGLERPPGKPVLNEVVKETKKIDVQVPAAETPQGPLQTPPPVAVDKPAQIPPPGPVGDTPVDLHDEKPIIPGTVPQVLPVPGNLQHDEAEDIVNPEPSTIHWVRHSEHYPLATEEIIPLPTGKPKAINKIQHEFKPETPESRSLRESKLNVIKEHFTHAWKGYKDHAWLHDELRPVSGDFKDPFAGWGATLVDALDTLWIMGLTEEFDAAVEGVKKIDFTTTPRDDIPLFETTIRYLGGLLAAYDLGGVEYKILLDKAVELAEILIGAFDTPNRMPVTYYHWKPAYASQPRHAGSNVVLAEIGSLSVEFTRLAQLTNDAKYYDAIARITDLFEESQNSTKLPGMWPTYVDATGCKKPEYKTPLAQQTFEQFPEPDNGIVNAPPVEAVTPSQEQAAPFSEDDGKTTPFTRPDPVLGKDGTEEPIQQDGKADKIPYVAHPGKPGKILGWEDDADETSLGRLSALQPEVKPNEKKPPKVETEKVPYAPVPGKPDKILGWNDAADERSLGKLTTGPTLEKDSTGPQLPDPRKVSAVQDWDDDGKDENIFQNLAPGEPGKIRGWEDKPASDARQGNLRKRQFDEPAIPQPNAVADPEAPPKAKPQTMECIHQGLVSASNFGADTYTLGGLSDSMYEYLPKQYILLGGLVEKYKTMYEKSMKPIRKHLIFRPMLPNEDDILVSGAYSLNGRTGEVDPDDGDLDPEGAHLTCFAGGMIGMGAKLFGIDSDLELAKKLTEGCVWAYNVTNSGIMPESFRAVACEDASNCKWNETKYWEAIDPYADNRVTNYENNLKIYSSQIEAAKAEATAAVQAAAEAANAPAAPPAPQAAPTPVVSSYDKRQSNDDTVPTEGEADAVVAKDDPELTPWEREFRLRTASLIVPAKPATREEYAKNHIKEERLPPGMKSINHGGRNYILRPEAIESVFYMYRITGNEHWREVGWQMFEAVVKHTRSKYGHSAIDDVTKESPVQNDGMESFWLAETLKYFYLLFSDVELISLDDWVFNTEAHPFRRPKSEL